MMIRYQCLVNQLKKLNKIDFKKINIKMLIKLIKIQIKMIKIKNRFQNKIIYLFPTYIIKYSSVNMLENLTIYI